MREFAATGSRFTGLFQTLFAGKTGQSGAAGSGEAPAGAAKAAAASASAARRAGAAPMDVFIGN